MKGSVPPDSLYGLRGKNQCPTSFFGFTVLPSLQNELLSFDSMFLLLIYMFLRLQPCLSRGIFPYVVLFSLNLDLYPLPCLHLLACISGISVDRCSGGSMSVRILLSWPHILLHKDGCALLLTRLACVPWILLLRSL